MLAEMSTDQKIERALRDAREWCRAVVLVIEDLYDGRTSCTSLRPTDDVAAQVARIESATDRHGNRKARVAAVIPLA